MKRPLLFICSPYQGAVDTNVENTRRYCRLAYERGGLPFAPHLLFTQFLDDSIAPEREAGLRMGLAMLELCDELWAYGTPTAGMAREISKAEKLGVPVRRFDSSSDEVITDE